MAKLFRHLRFYAFNFLPQTDNIIADYSEYILRNSASGPVNLVGYSGGGNLAFAVAQKLEAANRQVNPIIMIDSYRQPLDLQSLPEGVEKLKQQMILQSCRQMRQLGIDVDILRTQICAYYEHHWLHNKSENGQIKTDIINLYCQNKHIQTLLAQDEQLSTINPADWQQVSRGKVIALKGLGPHHNMLQPPYLEHNAQLLKHYLPQPPKASVS
jgi:thioesterase domain-containing protein